MLNFSASIVVYKTPIEVLRKSIESVQVSFNRFSEKFPACLKIYILDNSVCETYHKAISIFLSEFNHGPQSEVFLRVLRRNVGYGMANNSVIHELNSDFHLVMNPDVRVHPDAWINSMSVFKEDPSVVLLSPQVVSCGEAKVTTVLKRYPDCFTLLLRYLGNPTLSKLFRKRLDYYEVSPGEAESLSEAGVLAGGCFMFMKTESFKGVGGFGESFFMYFEDFDLSLRMCRLGRIVFSSDVNIEHDGGDVGRKSFSHHMNFSRSAITFFNLYGWKLF